MVIESLKSFTKYLHSIAKHPSRKVLNFRHLLGCDTIAIAQACWELQTAWAIKCSTLSCTEILKNSIMQVSREQNLEPKNMRNNVGSINNNLNLYEMAT